MRAADTGSGGIAVHWMWPLLLLGCSTTIYPPERPADPVSVFVLDHGRHASLVLPAGPGDAVRYAYGDWTWYAEAEPGLWAGVKALFCPSRAGLGRRRLGAAVSAEAVRAAVGVGVERVHELRVPRSAAEALVRQLDAVFTARGGTRRLTPEYNLEFVEHPRPYAAWHNSNHAVAGWLRQLGCAVRGPVLWSRWRVRQPGAPGPAPAAPGPSGPAPSGPAPSVP